MTSASLPGSSEPSRSSRCSARAPPRVQAVARLRDDLHPRPQFAAEFAEVHRQDLSRVRRPEGHVAFHSRAVLEEGHEERFAGEQALARPQQLAHEASFDGGPVSEDGLHADAILHVHHPSGLGHDGLPRVKLDLDELHLAAVKGMLDRVHARRQRGRLVHHE